MVDVLQRDLFGLRKMFVCVSSLLKWWFWFNMLLLMVLILIDGFEFSIKPLMGFMGASVILLLIGPLCSLVQIVFFYYKIPVIYLLFFIYKVVELPIPWFC